MMIHQKRSVVISFIKSIASMAIVFSSFLALIDSSIAQTNNADPDWAFEEEFQSNPASPSQDALPRRFEYVATHRTHPQEHFTKVFPEFLADHALNCDGPNREIVPLPQHSVQSTQNSNSLNPDPSFFICRNHMMSSMGETGAYSNTVFWPRQEFDFTKGGVIEFDVNINEGHTQRHWWELLIAPRNQIKFAAAPQQSAVDEPYPRERIVLDFRNNVRQIRVGERQFAPDGWTVEERQFARFDFAYWRTLHPFDDALDDRRIRRTMRVTLEDNKITWGIETQDGSFDNYTVDVPGGLPFKTGVVQFKTHAYTPAFSGGNFDVYTFHWDNIRFSGPVLAPYEAYHANDVVYLQRNGDRPIGDEHTVTIDLPNDFRRRPVLLGQMHGALKGQALLSVNGGPDIPVTIDNSPVNDCVSGQWRDWISFRLPLDPSQLRTGTNTFRWKIGSRPACATDNNWWNGYSVKFLHIQTAGDPDAANPNNRDNFGWMVPINDTLLNSQTP